MNKSRIKIYFDQSTWEIYQIITKSERVYRLTPSTHMRARSVDEYIEMYDNNIELFKTMSDTHESVFVTDRRPASFGL